MEFIIGVVVGTFFIALFVSNLLHYYAKPIREARENRIPPIPDEPGHFVITPHEGEAPA